MKQGLTQIYCGPGKGKTTAVIGLGIRALGNNLKVIMIQFLKNDNTGECKLLKTLEPGFKIFHFEKERGFTWTLTEEEKGELVQEIHMALKFAKKVMDTGECDILILDEILGVLQLGFADVEEITQLIDEKPEFMELVLTGRNLPDEIKERADYVSCIDAVKHPMEQGIRARAGIEF
ncbi:MAG: cob(I)yrinic acid a,c-diamide adenosyltransferase [Niameybacter sp.]|uniref:cob(I)yrinic acid a,c-diamide adenosyltransferase n=1 Tax=Niameybacter sp. TaxID=2033640 RepID=UPI002FC6DEE6